MANEPSFSSGAGAGSLAFQIQGFGSLEGAGTSCCTDGLVVMLDGVLLFAGTFNLGGGGTNIVFSNPNGGTFNASSPGFGLGGLLDVTIPLLLSAGPHALQFAYFGTPQGTDDEGWGINSVTVSGIVAATPLPAAFPLFASGLGALGLIGWRRKRKASARAA